MSVVKQIVVEMEERVVVRSGEIRSMDNCPICRTVTEMATPWLAATLHRSTERTLFRLIELGLIHASEGDRILLCLSCVNKTLSDSAEAVLIKPIGILEKP